MQCHTSDASRRLRRLANRSQPDSCYPRAWLRFGGVQVWVVAGAIMQSIIMRPNAPQRAPLAAEPEKKTAAPVKELLLPLFVLSLADRKWMDTTLGRRRREERGRNNWWQHFLSSHKPPEWLSAGVSFELDCVVAQKWKSTTRNKEQVQKIHQKIATIQEHEDSSARAPLSPASSKWGVISTI